MRFWPLRGRTHGFGARVNFDSVGLAHSIASSILEDGEGD